MKNREEIVQGLQQIIQLDLTQRMRFHSRWEGKSPEERLGLPTPKEIAVRLLTLLRN